MITEALVELRLNGSKALKATRIKHASPAMYPFGRVVA